MRFQPGVSGNPAGRPKGIKDRRTIFKEYVEPSAPALINKAVELAKAGDQQMLKIILDRIFPALPKDDLLPTEVTLLKGRLTDQTEHIKNLISDKHITPQEGNTLLTGVKTSAEIKYKEDLERELEELKGEFKAFREKFGK